MIKKTGLNLSHLLLLTWTLLQLAKPLTVYAAVCAPPDTCNYSTSTVPLNGAISCVWHRGSITYFCPYSGGCGSPPPYTAPLYTTVSHLTFADTCATNDPAVQSTITSGCFTGKTEIDTPKGPEEIKNLKVGDLVWSYNFESKSPEVGIVTKVFFHADQPYVLLHSDDGTILEATPNHPIYDVSKNQFTRADKLTGDSKFLSLREGNLEEHSVVDRNALGLKADVYNIEVEPRHNYFAKGILVHNKFAGSGPATVTDSPDYLYSCAFSCSAGFQQCGSVCAATPTPTPFFTFSPDPLSLGSIPAGLTTVSSNITITNTGAGDASGCTVSKAGTNPSNFTISVPGACSSLLNTNGSCVVGITGTPTTAGSTYYSNLKIDCTTPAFTTGSGTSNGISVSANAAGGLASLSATAGLSGGMVDLGSVVQSAAPAITRTVTITNSSALQDALGCGVSVASSDFAVSGCSGTITKLSSCTITITGQPITAAISAPIPITQLVTLNCATAPGTANITFNAKETSQSFPNVLIHWDNGGTTNAYTWPSPISAGSNTDEVALKINNTRTLTASGCTISQGGPDTAFFTLPSTNAPTAVIPTTVPAGSTAQFRMGATPPGGTPGGATYYKNKLTVTCTNTTDPNYNGGGYSFTSPAPSGTDLYQYQVVVSCSKGQYLIGGVCFCPTGYQLVSGTSEGSACRPILPSSEYYQIVSDVKSDGYPVCGPGRLPVTNAFGVYDVASSGQPDTKSTYNYTASGVTYKFNGTSTGAVSSPTVPTPNYIYSGLTHCACSSADYPVIPSAASTAPVVTNGAFATDSYDTIFAQQAKSAQSSYGRVPLATDDTSNGYLGTVFGTGGSVCGCPNFNETVTAIAGSKTGSACASALATDATTNNYKILTPYDPTTMSAQVFTAVPAGTANVKTVKLPAASGTYQTYQRRIWTCAPPTELDTTTGKCVFSRSRHACDDGTYSASAASVVSAKLSGGSKALKFQNSVNKKLACCMNSFDPLSPNSFLKFDCKDNTMKADGSPITYTSFDALWSGSDAAVDGDNVSGQPYAIALSNSGGQLVTGFYTLAGQRCSEFSEFAGTISAARINQAIESGQQSRASGTSGATVIEDLSATYSVSKPSAIAHDTKWSSWLNLTPAKRVPATAADMRRCPMLARAAIQVKCPAASPLPPAAQNVYADPISNVIHCTAAQSVQIHLRVEQIYEVAGLAKLKPVDTVLDTSQASTVSVGDMIKKKTVGICPAKSILQGDGSCTYQ